MTYFVKVGGKWITNEPPPKMKNLYVIAGATTVAYTSDLAQHAWTSKALSNTMAYAIGISPDKIVVGGAGAAMDVIDVKTGNVTHNNLPDTPGMIFSIEYFKNTWVATGQSSVAYWSSDAVTWTKVSIPPATSGFVRGLAQSPTRIVSVGYGATGAYSDDGKSWTPMTMPTTNNWRGVAYGNGKFVAVSIDGSTAAVSPDGVTWTGHAMPSVAWRAIAFGNGKFVATNQGKSTSSPDGVTWTNGGSSGNASESICYLGGYFLSVAAGSTNNYAVSNNFGTSWSDGAGAPGVAYTAARAREVFDS